MNISILTVFPALYQQFLNTSLIKRAQEQSIVRVDVDSYFAFVEPKERIDSPVYGNGSGMLIKPEVFERAINCAQERSGKAYKVLLSPQGKKLDQPMLMRLAQELQNNKHILFLTSRYEGIDERVEEEYADEVISLGDFVLLGGDIPTMAILEGMIRLLPGVVGKESSVSNESFSGPFLDYPTYTVPLEWHGKKVPDVVRSGNHGALDVWRRHQAIKKTLKNHFAWVRKSSLTKKDKQEISSLIPRHYVVLVHGDVLVGSERLVGDTSVTSIDLHDIARSSCTYGVHEFAVVTPLADQQKIVKKLLDFWLSHGVTYNKNRHEALRLIRVYNTVEDVVAEITRIEGVEPIRIATSALPPEEKSKELSFEDQGVVWGQERPVVIFFGTGQGLRSEFLQTCHYQLPPIEGLTAFNHLSVRSAVAIVLDRWLGLAA